MYRDALLAVLASTGLTGAAMAAGPPAEVWEIGPFIRGKNYSVGMPVAPQQAFDGARFVIPGPSAKNGHVHYVTMATGPLAGAKRITLKYRIDAGPGTRFVPQEHPDRKATLSLYFQRSGDRWSARYSDWRWYSPANRVVELKPGTHSITIGLDEDWVAMMGPGAKANPKGFRRALNETARIGFVFGSEGGRGHGVYATRPSRFTILDFRVD